MKRNICGTLLLGACLAQPLVSNAAERAAAKVGTFDARHELTVTVPEGAGRVRVWMAMPQNDPLQQVRDFKVQAPVPFQINQDSEGNEVVYLEWLRPSEKTLHVLQSFVLSRREQISGVDAKKTRPISEADRARLARYLEPNRHVIIDDTIRRLAKEIAGAEQNPVLIARRLYDWTLENVDYWVKDPQNKKASPVGSTEYCLTTRTGNCTDFHSLWTSLARASGIPTQMVYGSFFKLELNGQDADQSYHCWPEFYAPEIGWVPHDVAVADLFTGGFELNAANEKLVRLTTGDGFRGPDRGKIDYYFGNIDERRVTWSRGRDLILSPRQDAGPVNAMAKAYVEVDGKPHPEASGWVRKLTFREKAD